MPPTPSILNRPAHPATLPSSPADFFSRHSYGGGFLSPFVPVPIIPYPAPVPAGEAAEGAAAGAEGAEGTAAAGAAGEAGGSAGAAGEAGAAGQQDEPLERDLGGDDGGWFSGFGRDEDKVRAAGGAGQEWHSRQCVRRCLPACLRRCLPALRRAACVTTRCCSACPSALQDEGGGWGSDDDGGEGAEGGGWGSIFDLFPSED